MQRLARQVPIARQLVDYAGNLLEATHPENPQAPDKVRRYVRYGASPRGMQAMIIAAKIMALIDGRHNVDYPDLQAVLRPALRHRLILNFEGQAEGITPDEILGQVLKGVKTQ
jgi:MoxR-like ATPase